MNDDLENYEHDARVTTTAHDSGAIEVRMDRNETITHHGIQMTRAQAAALGIIEGPNGETTEAPRVEQKEPAAADADAEVDEPTPFAPDVEARASALGEQVPAEMQQAVIEQVLSTFDVSALDVTTAATLGLDPSDYANGVAEILDAFTAQASDAVRTLGISDPEAFFAWARENEPDAIRSAAREHVASRSARTPYRELVKDYFKATNPSADALRRGGFAAEQATNGETLVDVGGGMWTTVTAASRAGLI